VLLHVGVPGDLFVALEPVVDALGYLEEALIAVDDSPLSAQTEVFQQRDLCQEELGYASAVLR
jgi:hypothetical protein